MPEEVTFPPAQYYSDVVDEPFPHPLFWYHLLYQPMSAQKQWRKKQDSPVQEFQKISQGEERQLHPT